MKPTLVLTRAPDASLAFADRIKASFGESVNTVISPAMTIAFLPNVVTNHDGALIFTSANGVAWAKQRGLRAPVAWCVGQKTANAAQEIAPVVESADGTASDLVDLILARKPKQKLLHLTGEHQRGDVARRLTDAGLVCDSRVVYRQRLNDPSPALLAAARGTNPLVAPVFSPRSALLFGKLAVMGQLHGVAMSAAVADAMVDLGFDTVEIAQQPNVDAMAKATLNVLQRVTDGCI